MEERMIIPGRVADYNERKKTKQWKNRLAKIEIDEVEMFYWNKKEE
jgi:hypothetical protein